MHEEERGVPQSRRRTAGCSERTGDAEEEHRSVRAAAFVLSAGLSTRAPPAPPASERQRAPCETGMCLGCVWGVSGVCLGCVWGVSGVCLGCVWGVSGECVWGVCLGCVWGVWRGIARVTDDAPHLGQNVQLGEDKGRLRKQWIHNGLAEPGVIVLCVNRGEDACVFRSGTTLEVERTAQRQ